jgi:hypothetical protein
MADIHGYSGKPLTAKLGFVTGVQVLAVAAPAHYEALLGEPPEGLVLTRRTRLPTSGAFDFVHLFCGRRADLENQGAAALDRIAPGGALWVSWPKKSSKLFVDLTEDGVREVLLPTGWVDVKVCAVDADWSGLKLVRRRARR